MIVQQTMEDITQEVIDAAKKIYNEKQLKIDPPGWGECLQMAVKLKEMSMPREFPGWEQHAVAQGCQSCGQMQGHLETCSVFRK